MIAEADRRPLVDLLLGRIEQMVDETLRQAEQIQQLSDEIAVLKPQIKPRGMARPTPPPQLTRTPPPTRAARRRVGLGWGVGRDQPNGARPRSSPFTRPWCGPRARRCRRVGASRVRGSRRSVTFRIIWPEVSELFGRFLPHEDIACKGSAWRTPVTAMYARFAVEDQGVIAARTW